MNTPSAQSDLAQQLASLQSEQSNAKSQFLDTMSIGEILALINLQDQQVPVAVSQSLAQITEFVEVLVPRLKNGGRLIYLGAGTSGRLGILDAVECPPTFSVAPDLVQGLIAGGHQAVWQAVEGAEDDPGAASNDLEAIHFCEKDTLVGIAASGRTPYVLGGLDFAKKQGAVSAAISSNPNAQIFEFTDYPLLTNVGAEVLTGSSRMKSGTAQKLVLNMISTTAMIKMGKCYQNLMVDLAATNAKLKARSLNILRQVSELELAECENLLANANGQLKPAILMALTNINYSEANRLLASSDGQLNVAIKAHSIAKDPDANSNHSDKR